MRKQIARRKIKAFRQINIVYPQLQLKVVLGDLNFHSSNLASISRLQGKLLKRIGMELELGLEESQFHWATCATVTPSSQ